MIFPFSFWGADIFDGIVQNLELSENFTGWFTQWAPVVENLELTEDFDTYYTAVWAAVVETVELTEDFNAW